MRGGIKGHKDVYRTSSSSGISRDRSTDVQVGNCLHVFPITSYIILDGEGEVMGHEDVNRTSASSGFLLDQILCYQRGFFSTVETDSGDTWQGYNVTS
jgi:hypothetical protein